MKNGKKWWDDFARKKHLFHLDLDKLYFDDVTILTSYYYSGIHECISLELQWFFFVHNYSLGVREHLLLFFKNTIFKDFILQMNFHITFCFFNIINKPCHNLRSLIIIYNCIIIIVIILVDNLSYNGEFQYVVVFFLQF